MGKIIWFSIIILILIVVGVSLFFLLKADKRVTCETPECFEENFNKCKPAIWNSANVSGYGYSTFEVLGKENGLCNLRYIVSIPQTGELEQTCKVDNSLGLENAMTDPNLECKGSLYDYTQKIKNSVKGFV